MPKFHLLALFAVFAVVLANPLAQPAATSDADNWHLIADDHGNMNLFNTELEQEDLNSRFNPYLDISIELFTTANRQVGQRILLNSPAQLRASNFNRRNPTRFVIHGWRGDGNVNMVNVVRDAYLARGNINVFVVDWGLGAGANYVTARNRVAVVGNHVAQFIEFLMAQTSIALSSVIVVGHSLGAHIAGFTGKRVQRGRIQTIVALDPAYPLFAFNRPAERVSTSDAVYVESIQTNLGQLGFDQPLGHATFYPTFGRTQPGCGLDMTGLCSHERAPEFFAETIRNPRAMYGTRCEGFQNIRRQSCPSTGRSMPMGGEPVSRSADGVYFMPVNANSPFGQGVR